MKGNVIKIGARQFKLVKKANLEDEGLPLAGQINYHESTLSIDNSVSLDSQYQVLWHEVVHGIVHDRLPKGFNEHTIDQLASGIVQVLRDNAVLRKLP
jgi:hypothetical protein